MHEQRTDGVGHADNHLRTCTAYDSGVRRPGFHLEARSDTYDLVVATTDLVTAQSRFLAVSRLSRPVHHKQTRSGRC